MSPRAHHPGPHDARAERQAAAKEAAEADVRSIDEVRSVHNELTLVSSSEHAPIAAADANLTRNAKAALNTQSDLRHVDVSVKNGAARLTGKLPLGWLRLDAVTLVRATAGVRSVTDELHP